MLYLKITLLDRVLHPTHLTKKADSVLHFAIKVEKGMANIQI